MANSKGFFAVELEKLFDAIDLGINEACLYLIYCVGSGKSNDKTRWSVNALTRYTEIATRKGKKASTRLQDAKLTKQIKGGKHPQFEILKGDTEQIWLPNAFITAVDEEDAPLERLRKTGDPLVFKLLFKLYARCNIADDGGVQTDIIFKDFDKKKIAEHQNFILYGFDLMGGNVYPDTIHDCLSDVEKKNLKRDYAHEADLSGFWNRLSLLVEMGLIYSIPTLFDSEKGEPVVSLRDPFTSNYCSDLHLIDDQLAPEYVERARGHDYCLMIPKTYPNAVLKGVYVLRYRQHTEMVKAGYALTQERLERYMKTLRLAEYSEERRDQVQVLSYERH